MVKERKYQTKFGENGFWQIEPSLAVKWLKTQKINRTLRVVDVERWSRDMSAGKWNVNGETIKFDAEGALIDGQHRLQACLKAQTTFVSWVVFDLPVTTAQESVDIGRRRTPGDQLSLRGEIDTTNLAAALRWLWRYEKRLMLGYTGFTPLRTNSRQAPPTMQELFALLEQHPQIRKSLSYGNLTFKLLPKSLMTMLHYQMTQKDTLLADWFVRTLASGEALTQSDALWYLRRRLTDNRSSRAKLQHSELAALTIKAWNLHRAKKPCKALRFYWQGDKPENFPVIE